MKKSFCSLYWAVPLLAACQMTPQPSPVPQIYVTDHLNYRIVRMNDMTGAGWTTLGTGGLGANQFLGPQSVLVDGAGRIYVTDRGNNRIVRRNDMTGAGWTTLGTQGTGTNQFHWPNGIFIR
jgi:alkylated DNA repair dioxygenase AlkB